MAAVKTMQQYLAERVAEAEALGIVTGVPDGIAVVTEAEAQAMVGIAQADIDAHEADVANPHTVTAEQVGLGDVDNTSDADKPISTDTQAALDLKAPLASPTFTGTVTVPDNTAAGQALQIHAFDAATGRLAYEVDGVVFEVGDTGWIAVTGDVENDWGADLIQYRRERNTAWLQATGLDSSSATGQAFITLPAWMRPSIDTFDQLNRTQSLTSSVSMIRVDADGRILADLASAISSGSFMVSWVTDASWPVSL